jgi:nitrous oxidase accessory protein
MKLIASLVVCLCLFFPYFSGCIDANDSFTGSDISNLSVDITVKSDGTGDFISIQDALNASHENDIIFVFEGIYFENLFINKSVYLMGNDPEKTIIDGNKSDHVIKIVAEHVNISNFTIQNSGKATYDTDFDAGVQVDANSNTIMNCILRNNTVGILIHFRRYNKIEENTFYHNSYGVYTSSSLHNTISNNSFQTSSEYGIYIYSSSHYNYVKDNVFFNNSCGVRVKGNNNFVIRNIFKNNGGGLYFCCGAWGNIVYHNTFLNNTYYKGKSNYLENHWFKELPVGGNYWLDYNGEDTDGDGFGDSTYIVHERNNSGKWQRVEDKYPLMEPIVMI